MSHGALNAHFFKTDFTGLQSDHFTFRLLWQALFLPGLSGSRSRAGRYHSLQDLRPATGKPAGAPPLPARVWAPRPPASRLRLLLLSGTAARVATPLSPWQALAWAPAASMDARRVRVRAGWNNPRGWARLGAELGPTPSNSADGVLLIHDWRSWEVPV